MTTVEDIIALMERKCGKALRVWVMDRGMVSGEDLEFKGARGARYVAKTLQEMLRKFAHDPLFENWQASGSTLRFSFATQRTAAKRPSFHSADRKEKVFF